MPPTRLPIPAPRSARVALLAAAFLRGCSNARRRRRATSRTSARPRCVYRGDPGYVIGEQIAKWYYDRATDRTAALRASIQMRDGATFLAASGYDGGR